MEKDIKKYIPNIDLIRTLETKFSSDFETRAFDEKEDFETYLCALAYGCIGKELFYDAKIAYNLNNKLKDNDTFMQGMATYSILQKIDKAKQLMHSVDFEETMKIDFENKVDHHDHATIAFIMYYLSTNGFKVQWDKMCHDYCPINLSRGPVEFKNGQKVDPEFLLENIKSDLNIKSL